MNRPIPGTFEVAGREFMYIECSEPETFYLISDSESSLDVDLVMPTSGGVIEEKVRIKLRDGTSFLGISYKGDIEGWRERYIAFCEATGRKYAFIKDGHLLTSAGQDFLLEESEVSFEK